MVERLTETDLCRHFSGPVEACCELTRDLPNFSSHYTPSRPRWTLLIASTDTGSVPAVHCIRNETHMITPCDFLNRRFRRRNATRLDNGKSPSMAYF